MSSRLPPKTSEMADEEDDVESTEESVDLSEQRGMETLKRRRLVGREREDGMVRRRGDIRVWVEEDGAGRREGLFMARSHSVTQCNGVEFLVGRV